MLREIREKLSAAAREHEHQIAPAEDSTSVDTVSLLGCDVYCAVQTDRHPDPGFPRWTVLLALRTAGHSIALDDGDVTVCPRVGDLVMFDLQRGHSLDLPPEAFPADETEWFTPGHVQPLCRDFMFICAHVDLAIRPSRAEAERRLCEVLRPVLNAPLSGYSAVRAPR